LRAIPGISNIRLEWTAPSASAITYRVQRREGQLFTSIGTTDQLHYTDSDALEIAARYCYQIEALDGEENVTATSGTSCAIFGQLSMWTPNLSGTTGQQISVPIYLRNAGGLRILESDLWLDYAPDVLTFINGESTDYADGYGWQIDDSTNGRLRIQAIPDDAADPQSLEGDGALVYLIFKIEGAARAKSLLDLREFLLDTEGSTLLALDRDGALFNPLLTFESGLLTVEESGELYLPFVTR
jgi:hypothetical protein